MVIEACVVSAREAMTASAAGANRLELCRDLDQGGLTPDVEELGAAIRIAEVPLFAMVRPRAGSFRMSPDEVATMLQEVLELIAVGVSGIVLGVLDRSGRVDVPALAELVSAAERVPVTFHRAFDEVPDPIHALEAVAEAGVSRVLTSGGATTAWEGRGVLRDLVREAGERVVILGAGRVRGDHVRRLVDVTGLREVHARASAIAGISDALGD